MPVLQLTRELHQYNKHQQTKNQRDHTHPKLNWAAQREHASVRSTFGRSFSHNWTWSPASTGLNLPHQKRKPWGFNCSGMIRRYILYNKICVFWFQPCVNNRGQFTSWLLIGRKALSCQHSQGRFNDTTAQAQHQVQGGLLVRMTMAPWK